jgi:hypothetical protein
MTTGGCEFFWSSEGGEETEVGGMPENGFYWVKHFILAQKWGGKGAKRPETGRMETGIRRIGETAKGGAEAQADGGDGVVLVALWWRFGGVFGFREGMDRMDGWSTLIRGASRQEGSRRIGRTDRGDPTLLKLRVAGARPTVTRRVMV